MRTVMARSSQKTYLPALRFHWLTPYYDILAGATTKECLFKQSLIRQAGLEPGQQVLDLGTGTGTLSIWIKQHQPQAEVIGMDCDPAILAIAASKAKKARVAIHFDCAHAYDLPYPAEHFDRVVSSLLFHHLVWVEKERTAQELFRVLKPGAELHVADWGRPSNALMRGLFLFEQLYDGFKRTRDNVAGRLPSLFEQAGFTEVVEEQTFDTIFGTLALYSAKKPGL